MDYKQIRKKKTHTSTKTKAAQQKSNDIRINNKNIELEGLRKYQKDVFVRN